jgi:hypothetical protein
MRHQETIDYARLKNESAATYDGWQAYGRGKLSNILMAKVGHALCCAMSRVQLILFAGPRCPFPAVNGRLLLC